AFENVAGTGAKHPLLDELTSMVVARKPPSDEVVRETIKRIESLNEGSTATPNYQLALRKVALAVMLCDFVFAIVADGMADAKRIKVHYQKSYPQGVRGLGGRLKRAVGLGRTDFTLELGVAGESRSFHLDVQAPETLYVEDSYVEGSYSSGNGAEVSATDSRPRNQVVDFGRRTGDNFAHLYMRDFDGTVFVPVHGATDKWAKTKPRFRLELKERPPGILAPMLAVSFWLASLTWVVGLFHTSVFSAGAGPAWPTVIFGIPAVVTGWLLSKITAKDMRSTSIGTFFLLAWLSLDAALVVVVAALKTSGVTSGVLDFGAVHIEHPTWSAMMLLTVLNFATCLAVFTVRNTRYAATINEGTPK
ncbi:MAG: hypothetical protein ABIP33_09510, partial [Pseudolysinimonas sp.]